MLKALEWSFSLWEPGARFQQVGLFGGFIFACGGGSCVRCETVSWHGGGRGLFEQAFEAEQHSFTVPFNRSPKRLDFGRSLSAQLALAHAN